MMRTHYCGAVTEALIGETVEICGWVHRRRDHGGVIFLDVRDREGLLQVVFQPENETFALAETIRSEYVLRVKGLVRQRPEGQTNPNMATGQIEVVGDNLTILNQAKTPPFPLNERSNVGEDVRLTHRTIDLRRPEMQARLIKRAHVNQFVRQYLANDGFLEIETPYLTKATPEGARDYLVPSRTHQGSFFALPQSPQLFKQMLMMSGFDRYFQVVRCFRDEDLRADRQPEFTQLDIEMSFVDESDIMGKMTDLVQQLFKSQGAELPSEFTVLSYDEAMRLYGSDKPDLRIPLELIDICDIVKESEFKVFADPANNPESRVVALKLTNGCELLTRKMIDELTSFVGIYGAKGLAYIKVNDLSAGMDGLQSPIIKFMDADHIKAIIEKANAANGDIVFFGAGKASIVNAAMGALRVKLGTDLNLFTTKWAPLWVTEFPMFECEDAKMQSMHHPFTAPNVDTVEELKKTPPHRLYSRSYDMVINGYEVGGGSIRIHDTEMQSAVLALLGIDDEKAAEKFGFLLNSLEYGTPPHGGIAFGIDRLSMLLTGTDNIRDVIAFPKTQSAACLLTQAPSEVDFDQLQELGVRVVKPAE